jgi:hypothetical protein
VERDGLFKFYLISNILHLLYIVAESGETMAGNTLSHFLREDLKSKNIFDGQLLIIAFQNTTLPPP